MLTNGHRRPLDKPPRNSLAARLGDVFSSNIARGVTDLWVAGKRILPEATSEPITEFFEGVSAEELTVSHWTRVEFASLLAREVRMGNLDAAAAREAGAKFETIVEESFVALLPNRNDFDRAREWLSRFETGLRAGDALHLAIASNRRAVAIYSLDKVMIAAGRTLGVPTSPGILLPGYDS